VVAASQTWNPSANNPAKVAVRTWPLTFNIADFDNSPAGTYSTRPDYVSAGSANIDASWLYSRGYLSGPGGGTLTSKIYYTDGNISITASSLNGTATFVARGSIDLTFSSGNLRPLFNNLNSFSNKGTGACGTTAMNITASNATATGILYAPNGGITVVAASGSVDGSIVANQISVTAASIVKAGPGSTSLINPYVGLDVW
jgi:hypothetical protein